MTPGFDEEEAVGKVYDAQLIARMWPLMRPHWRFLLAGSLLIPIRPLLMLIPASLFGVALNHLSGQGGFPGLKILSFVAEPPGGIPLIPWLGFVFLCVTGLLVLVEFARQISMAVLGGRTMRALRERLFDHVQRLPLKFFDTYPVGRLVTRLGNDVESLGEMFSGGLIMMIADLFLMTVFASVLFYLNWELALVAMAVVPVLVVASIIFRWKVREAYRLVRVRIARINAHLQETITGMKVVQLFAREKRNFGDFSAINREHRNAWFRSINFDALLSASIELSGNLTIALILWYGAQMLEMGVVDLGLIFVFYDYMRKFIQPLQELSARYSVMQSSMASLERIFQLLDVEPEPEEAIERREVVGAVEFENVTFAYNPDDPVLKGLSFRVEPGERIALVGHTGAGKTTILKLLARMYEPQRGRILVDGVDIREFSRAELRRHIAFVLQDVFLFTGDIAYNIGLGRDDISQEEIESAARTVHVDEFVRRLPDGYAHEVRERGLNFSVGERQLLSFARALAQRPQILLLDEATSSVDTETEVLIQDALHRLMEGKTSMVVAHRLSTIQDVDRIYVLHHGEIREVGNHEALLAERGLYWRLYQLQYAAQDAA